MSTSSVCAPALFCVLDGCQEPTVAFGFVAVNNAGAAHGLDSVGNILDSDIDTMFLTNVFRLHAVDGVCHQGYCRRVHIHT